MLEKMENAENKNGNSTSELPLGTGKTCSNKDSKEYEISPPYHMNSSKTKQYSILPNSQYALLKEILNNHHDSIEMVFNSLYYYIEIYETELNWERRIIQVNIYHGLFRILKSILVGNYYYKILQAKSKSIIFSPEVICSNPKNFKIRLLDKSEYTSEEMSRVPTIHRNGYPVMSASFFLPNKKTFNLVYFMLSIIKNSEFTSEIVLTKYFGMNEAFYACIIIEFCKIMLKLTLFYTTPFKLNLRELDQDFEMPFSTFQSDKTKLSAESVIRTYDYYFQEKIDKLQQKRHTNKEASISAFIKKFWGVLLNKIESLFHYVRENKRATFAEFLYFVSPIIRLSLFFTKKKSLIWLSWIIPLCLEALSLLIYKLSQQSAELTPLDIHETRSRQQDLFLYMIRTPFIDLWTNLITLWSTEPFYYKLQYFERKWKLFHHFYSQI